MKSVWKRGGGGGGGTGFILVGTKLSKRVSVPVTELYTGLELPCNRETLSQQFGTVNGNACSLLGSGYDIRYCFANCSTDGLRISFRLELVKRPAVNNPCSRVQQVWHRLRNERWNKRVKWLLRWWNLIERKSNWMSILLPFLVKRV